MRRPLRLSIAVSAALLLAPLAADAAALTSSCTAAISGPNDTRCDLPLAGPNLSVRVEVFAPSSTPTSGLVFGVVLIGDSSSPYQAAAIACQAQGMFTNTKPLLCGGDLALLDVAPNVAIVPAGLPMQCLAYTQGAIAAGRLDCVTYSF